MKQFACKAALALGGALAAVFGWITPVLANANLNPNTGDESGSFIGIAIAGLVIAAVLIVVYVVMSKKGKKGKGKAGGSRPRTRK